MPSLTHTKPENYDAVISCSTSLSRPCRATAGDTACRGRRTRRIALRWVMRVTRWLVIGIVLGLVINAFSQVGWLDTPRDLHPSGQVSRYSEGRQLVQKGQW